MIFRFLHPWLFAAALILPLMFLAYRWMERKGRARVMFSDISAFKAVPPSLRVRARHGLIWLRALTLVCLVVALARPQHGNRTQTIMSKGIDIMIALDDSGSMKEQDMDPTRLDAAKKVIQNFINGRYRENQNDRIGLVSFSRVAFTQCPLTVDYTILRQIVSRVTFARKEFDGTAIGTALATAVGRLKDSKAKSKVVILVTDGQNNAGIDPMIAASMAEALKIKVYTIGVVPTGFMQKHIDKFLGVTFIPSMSTVDETQMQEIAKQTGGKYFRATDEEALQKIFDEIDKLEKTEVKIKEFYRYSEIFRPWVALALCLFIAEIVLGGTALRRLP